jgi:hypothetical protein
MTPMHGLGENRVDAADPYVPLLEHAGDPVRLRAGEQR